MFYNFLKIAFRNYFKNRVSTSINIIGLTLGMLCCIIILLWVQDELSFDKFHKNGDQLYLVVNQLDGEWGAASPWALTTALKKDYPEVEKATRFSQQQMLVKYNDNSFYESAGLVDPDFLTMFSFPMIKGDPASALNTVSSVVITEKMANKYFRNEDPVGKLLQVNQNTFLTVTGVVKNVPSNSTFTFDMLIPVKILGEEKLSSWAWETEAYVLVKKNVSVDDLKAKIAGLSKKYDKRTGSKVLTHSLMPFSRIHLHSLNSIGPILYVYLFSGIAIIVLIIACINFINLFSANASIRWKEIGIRKVVGAGKQHIIRQFYGETLLLSIFAFIMAGIITSMILPYFNIIAEKQLKIDFINNPALILGSVILILLTTIAAGSYPALMFSSFHPITVLKGTLFKGSKKSAMRWTLVMVQFTVSIVLITLTITMIRQIDYIQKKNLGFNREQVISIPMNDELQKNYESLKNDLLQYPGILHIASAGNNPLEIGSVNPVTWEGREPGNYEFFNYFSTDYDYLETFGMKLIEGRSFSKEFSTDVTNYIVNEAAVSYMKMKNPVGKLFSIWSNKGKIIGVVKNFHSQSLHNGIPPLVITLTRFLPHSGVYVRINPGDMKSSLSYIEKKWKEYVPDYPFQYEFLDEAFHRQYMSEERIKSLFQYFSAFAIFISCIGLFGLAAFIAQSRTKEIGIRKVVGATVQSLTILMLKDFTKWILISICAAVPVSYYVVNRWMSNFVYRTAIDWWIFALAGGLVLLIALFTISYQAVKAAIANPVENLRSE